jgi:hypothetical protein
MGAMAAPSMRAGPHGYDWLIGSWTCTSNAATQIGGPASQRLTFAKSAVGSLYVRVTGKNFDGVGFIVYDPKTKTWSNPFALADGSYEDESSTASGNSVTFTGPFVAPGAKPQTIRDTFTRVGATKYTDLGESQSGTSWKASYKTNCSKT